MPPYIKYSLSALRFKGPEGISAKILVSVEKNTLNEKPLDRQLRDYPFIRLLIMSGILALCVTGATHAKGHVALLVVSAKLSVPRRFQYGNRHISLRFLSYYLSHAAGQNSML